MTATPFFGLALTLLFWHLAVRFQRKTGWLICNPVPVSGLLIIAVLFDLPDSPANYSAGGSIIQNHAGAGHGGAGAEYLPAARHFEAVLPASAVLGVPGGQPYKSHVLPVLLLCQLFQSDTLLINSLLPKSVTTAIAVSIAESGGGLPGITTAAVIVTGIEGAVLAPLFAKVFHITDPVAEGVAIGACSHAVGTSKAAEIGQLQGAISSIALCVCGIMTSVLVMFFKV